MARPTSPTLTDAELRLMAVLWERGASTAAEIAQALPGRDRVSDSTVRTILRILEEKGYVRHEKQGRAFLYEPTVGRQEVRRNVIRYLVDRFFNRSPELLVLDVLAHEEVSDTELRRLKRLVEESGP